MTEATRTARGVFSVHFPSRLFLNGGRLARGPSDDVANSRLATPRLERGGDDAVPARFAASGASPIVALMGVASQLSEEVQVRPAFDVKNNRLHEPSDDGRHCRPSLGQV